MAQVLADSKVQSQNMSNEIHSEIRSTPIPARAHTDPRPLSTYSHQWRQPPCSEAEGFTTCHSLVQQHRIPTQPMEI